MKATDPPHDFDTPTAYCLNCGQAQEHVEDHQYPCFGGGNLIAISHRIARRRLGALTGLVWQTYENIR